MREYFDDLNLAIGIVDDLNLNRRIWGKDKIEKPLPKTDKTADDLIRKGAKLFKSGNYQEAIEAYTGAIAVNPKHSTAYFNRGVINIKMGNLKQAVEDLRISAKLGHQRAQKILKSQDIDKMTDEVLNKGEVIAFCDDVPGNCYRGYKGYAWYQSLKPRSITKVCSIGEFIKQVEAGEIKAEMMEDWLG